MRKKELLDEIELLKKRVQDLENRLILQEIRGVPLQPYINPYPLAPMWPLGKIVLTGNLQNFLPEPDIKIICNKDTV